MVLTTQDNAPVFTKKQFSSQCLEFSQVTKKKT